MDSGLSQFHHDVCARTASLLPSLQILHHDLLNGFKLAGVNLALFSIEFAVLDPPSLLWHRLQDLVLLPSKNERLQHRSGTFDSLCGEQSVVILITRAGFVTEYELEIFPAFLEQVRHNESQQRYQLDEIVLQRRSGQEQSKLGRNPNELVVCL